MSNSSRWKQQQLLSEQFTLLNIEVCESLVWNEPVINSTHYLNQNKEASSDKVSLSWAISS